MSKSWYVVNSYSGYENKAKEQLLERIERENLNDFFGGIEVPTQTITEMKAGKEKITEKKFFPGYVLVQMEMNDETWHLVKETPRVLGFIGGTKNNPKPISEAEANKILQQQEEGVQPSAQITTFEPGEMIRVIDGPLMTLAELLKKSIKIKARLKLQ